MKYMALPWQQVIPLQSFSEACSPINLSINHHILSLLPEYQEFKVISVSTFASNPTSCRIRLKLLIGVVLPILNYDIMKLYIKIHLL